MIKPIFNVLLAFSFWSGLCQDCPNKMIFQHPELEGVAFNSGGYFTKRERIILDELQAKYQELKAVTANEDSLHGFSLDGIDITVDIAVHSRYLSPAFEFTVLIENVNPGTTNAHRTENAMKFIEDDKKRVTLALQERGMSVEEVDELIALTSGTNSFFSFILSSHNNFERRKKAFTMKESWDSEDLGELAYSGMDRMSFIYTRWADSVFEQLSPRVTKIITSYLCEQSSGGGGINYWSGEISEEHMEYLRQELDQLRNALAETEEQR